MCRRRATRWPRMPCDRSICAQVSDHALKRLDEARDILMAGSSVLPGVTHLSSLSRATREPFTVKDNPRMSTCVAVCVSVSNCPSSSTVCLSLSSFAGASVAHVGSTVSLPTITAKLSVKGSSASGCENVTGRASFIPEHRGSCTPVSASCADRTAGVPPTSPTGWVSKSESALQLQSNATNATQTEGSFIMMLVSIYQRCPFRCKALRAPVRGPALAAAHSRRPLFSHRQTEVKRLRVYYGRGKIPADTLAEAVHSVY